MVLATKREKDKEIKDLEDQRSRDLELISELHDKLENLADEHGEVLKDVIQLQQEVEFYEGLSESFKEKYSMLLEEKREIEIDYQLSSKKIETLMHRNNLIESELMMINE